MFKIIDPIALKLFEKRIKRPLTDLECEALCFGEPIVICDEKGDLIVKAIDVLCLADLMPIGSVRSTPVQAAKRAQKIQNESNPKFLGNKKTKEDIKHEIEVRKFLGWKTDREQSDYYTIDPQIIAPNIKYLEFFSELEVKRRSFDSGDPLTEKTLDLFQLGLNYAEIEQWLHSSENQIYKKRKQDSIQRRINSALKIMSLENPFSSNKKPCLTLIRGGPVEDLKQETELIKLKTKGNA